MFLLDTLLLAPGKAAFFLLEELAKKAQEEFLNDDVVKQELQEIYALLEAGRISETDFEARELRLVERLEQIAMAKQLQDGWGTSDMGMQIAALDGEVMEEPDMVIPPETHDDDEASPAPYAPLASDMMTPPGLNAQMLSDIMKTPALTGLLNSIMRTDSTPAPAAPPIADVSPARNRQLFSDIMRALESSRPAAALPASSLTDVSPALNGQLVGDIARALDSSRPPAAGAALPIAEPPAPVPVRVSASAPLTMVFDTTMAPPRGDAINVPDSSRPSVVLPAPPTPPAPPVAWPPSLAAAPAPPVAWPPALAAPPVAWPQEPASLPAAGPASLTMVQVIQSTMSALSMLRLKVSSVTSIARAEGGWRVTAEVLERRSVPDTSDLLGVYEFHLDDAGNVLRYERTHMRRRCDLGRCS